MILAPLDVLAESMRQRQQIAQLELELRAVRRKLEDEIERRHAERAAAYRHGVLDGLDARLVQMRRALGDKVAHYEPLRVPLTGAASQSSPSEEGHR